MKRVLSALTICLTLFVVFCNFPSPAHAGTVDLRTEYNLLFGGASADDNAGYYAMSYGDVDNNGRDDLLINAHWADSNTGYSGSIYIVYDALLDEFLASGTTDYDLADSNSYNLRIDGNASEYSFGHRFYLADVTNDGKLDIIEGGAGNTVNNYIIPNEVFSGYSGSTGNTLNMDDSQNYSYKIDNTASSESNYLFSIGDYNGDGRVDVLLSRSFSAFNGSKSGSFYLLENSLISSETRGQALDLTDSSDYTVRIDGPAATSYGTFNSSLMGDLDGNGKDDVVVGDVWYGSLKGSTIIIMDSIIEAAAADDQLIDLSQSSDYTLFITGAASSMLNPMQTGDIDADGKYEIWTNKYMLSDELLNDYTSGVGQTADFSSSLYTLTLSNIQSVGLDNANNFDYNNDGETDQLVTDAQADYSGENFGSFYILKNSAITSLTGTGNSLDVTNSSNYWARYDGGAALYNYGHGLTPGDFNGDGKYDIVMGVDQIDYDGRSDSGAVWVVLNFPHTVSISSTAKSGSSVRLQGTVSASLSVTDISGVEYRIDDNSPGSGWTGCRADDGAFDSTSEAFTCNIPNAPESESHTIYVRAYDANTSYTARARYASYSYGSSSSEEIQIPQMSTTGGGGVLNPVKDSNTGNQKVVAIIEPYTIKFDAFLSAIKTETDNLYQSLFTPSIVNSELEKSSNLLFVGDGAILGITTLSGTFWQVGNVQNIWYKSYPPSNSSAAPAIIIPELQAKPSIISLSYTDQDLIPPGQPDKPFNSSSLKLANSRDGYNWEVLANSVVDTENKVVAAIHKLGGYYTIVSGTSVQAKQYALGQSLGVSDNIEDDSKFEEKKDITNTQDKQSKSIFKKIKTFIVGLFH